MAPRFTDRLRDLLASAFAFATSAAAPLLLLSCVVPRGTVDEVTTSQRCASAGPSLTTLDQLASVVGTQATLLGSFKGRPAPAITRAMVRRSSEANRAEQRHRMTLTALCPVLTKATLALSADLGDTGDALLIRGREVEALCPSITPESALEIQKAASRVQQAVGEVQQRCTGAVATDVHLPTACAMSMHVAVPLLAPIRELPTVVQDLDDQREAVRRVGTRKPFDGEVFAEPLRALGAIEGTHGAGCTNAVGLASDHLARHTPGGAEADLLEEAKDAIEALATQCTVNSYNPWRPERVTPASETTAQANQLSKTIRAAQRSFAAVLEGCQHSDARPE